MSGFSACRSWARCLRFSKKERGTMKKGWALFLQRLKSIPRTALLFYGLFIIGIGIGIFQFAEKWLQPTSFVQPFRVALVDEERSLETRMILRQFQQAREVSDLLTFVEADKQQAERMLASGEVVATLLVPQSFSDDLQIGKNTPLIVDIGRGRSVEALLFVEMMRSGTNLINASQTAINTTYSYLKDWGFTGQALQNKIDEAIIYFTLKSLKRGELVAQETMSATGDFSWTNYYQASLLIILPFLFSLFMIPIANMSLKSEVIKRLISMNVGAFSFVISTFYLLFVIVAAQMLILGGIVLLFGEGLFDWGDLLLLFNVAFFFAAYFSFFASFRELSGFWAFLVGGALIVIGGLVVPVSFLPEWVQVTEKLSPFYWLHQLLLERGGGAILVTFSLSILFLFLACKPERNVWGARQ